MSVSILLVTLLLQEGSDETSPLRWVAWKDPQPLSVSMEGEWLTFTRPFRSDFRGIKGTTEAAVPVELDLNEHDLDLWGARIGADFAFARAWLTLGYARWDEQVTSLGTPVEIEGKSWMLGV